MEIYLLFVHHIIDYDLLCRRSSLRLVFEINGIAKRLKRCHEMRQADALGADLLVRIVRRDYFGAYDLRPANIELLRARRWNLLAERI